MIVTNPREAHRNSPNSKWFRACARFIGKMPCRQLGLAVFLLACSISLLIWSWRARTAVSTSTGMKTMGYGIEEDLSPKGDDSSNMDMPRKMLGLIDDAQVSDPNMAYRIRELIRIKNSVQKELHNLEAQRSEMQRQVTKQILETESSVDKILESFLNLYTSIVGF